jgi:hypothetical protein
MSKVTTDDVYSKDVIVAMVEQNNGVTNTTHKSTGIGKRGKWVINIEFNDTLEGLQFMKDLRAWEDLDYEV